MIRLRDACRHYGEGETAVRALDQVSLRVERGEMVALVGASGSGKSTLLNILSAVDRPTSGVVNVDGVDLGAASEADLLRLRRESIGLVFQAFHLVPHLTVEENVAVPLALAGGRDPERVDALIARVGLEHRRRHVPGELSGGEQQRTALARALIHRPKLLVADEPTGNLDSRTGEEVLHLLTELHREEGLTLVLATHERRLADATDRVFELADGRLVSSS
jgi:putative ABC transport system ATP-binding protein